MPPPETRPAFFDSPWKVFLLSIPVGALVSTLAGLLFLPLYGLCFLDGLRACQEALAWSLLLYAPWGLLLGLLPPGWLVGYLCLRLLRRWLARPEPRPGA